MNASKFVKAVILTGFAATFSFAANCVTVDSKGMKAVVDCSALTDAEEKRASWKSESGEDSAAYQNEVETRIQERLGNMSTEEAQRVQSAIDAARARTDERKAGFIENRNGNSNSNNSKN
ncbi:MAG TPA: hypothetical protein VLM37_05260 [Fibrobacteraceae bacterium]|nr:hypothetical protein [Fibrobacteraceae bacterium]